ncbi:hypothetical protein AA0113_g9526 [Alternaria arborescens]|uniref:Rhodopsin domain-containing protein n=1 Tax=Alternaria arborescens TaxID=156630 RepID=A0A4Q4R979_9PLEO|nr:hypothetical protein AA0111_g2670 [Alternaria arborescens]RYO36296.1 hypothetical protein AA0111_g2670 [Alternaria arborescens]RYO53001.1 hypothetical protein AA0113_g9526 [Alternaria arborescens]
MGFKPDAGVMCAMTITFGVATILLICRIISRRMTNVALWLDDYFAMVSWVAAALYCGFALYWALVMGLGHVKADIPHPAEEVDEYARFGLFMAEFLYAWSLGMSKLAILCFYWRLFSVSNIRPGIYILGACTIIWLTIRTFMTIFHCIPVQAYWNFNIKDAVCTIDPGKFMFGTTLVHLLLEISVLLLPVFQVASLRLRPGQKFAVVAMFMFGIFVCAASIVVLIVAINLNAKTTEMSRDVKGVIIWAGTESYLAIISSCLPITRPVFRKFLSGSILGSKSHSTGPNPLSDFSGKGIKLRNSHRTKELDDNSSERQLAQHEDGSSGRGDMYYESYAERGGYNKTVVSRVDEVSDGNANAPGTYGIQVRNETNVRYESI